MEMDNQNMESLGLERRGQYGARPHRLNRGTLCTSTSQSMPKAQTELALHGAYVGSPPGQRTEADGRVSMGVGMGAHWSLLRKAGTGEPWGGGTLAEEAWRDDGNTALPLLARQGRPKG